MPNPPSSKLAKYRKAIGSAAECAVEQYLLDRGYQILGKNLRVGHLEVDLLVKKGDLVAVVEVRFRSNRSWQGPFESMNHEKQDRVVAAGRSLWRQMFESDASVNRMRFDAASVVFTPENGFEIEYAEGFWQSS